MSEIRVNTIDTKDNTSLSIQQNNTTALTIDTSQNVGIGTSSPATKLDIAGNLRFSLGSPVIELNNGGPQIYTTLANTLMFATGGGIGTPTERMRVDSSGNVLVGKTSVTINNIGVELRPFGNGGFTRDAGVPLNVNRLTDDGNIIGIYKDGTTVGSIGSASGNLLTVINGDIGLKFSGGLDAVYSCDGSGSTTTNTVNLGVAGSTFKDLYLGGNIYLGGTGSANALDDYEEGTWTPVLSDAGTGGNTATMGTATGSYTKIGRLVTLSVLCLDINTSGMTAGNVLHLQGLPFSTNANNDAGRHRAAVLVDNINFTNYIMAETAPSSAVLQFQNVVDSSGDVQVKVQDILSAGSDIRFTFTYFSA